MSDTADSPPPPEGEPSAEDGETPEPTIGDLLRGSSPMLGPAIPGWSDVVKTHQAVSESNRRSREALSESLRVQFAKERAAEHREITSLDLTGRMVELQAELVAKQNEMVQMQKAQDTEQAKSARREWTMIWIAALSLLVAIGGVVLALLIA